MCLLNTSFYTFEHSCSFPFYKTYRFIYPQLDFTLIEDIQKRLADKDKTLYVNAYASLVG